jgi:hypothetical protein
LPAAEREAMFGPSAIKVGTSGAVSCSFRALCRKSAHMAFDWAFSTPSHRLGLDVLGALNSARFRVHTPTSGTPEVLEFFEQASLAEYAVRANQTMSFFVPQSKGHDDLLNAAVLTVQAGPLAAHRVASGRRVAASLSS